MIHEVVCLIIRPTFANISSKHSNHVLLETKPYPNPNYFCTFIFSK